VAVRQWRIHRGATAGWAAATFGLLAGVALLGRLIAPNDDTTPADWVAKILLVLLAFFPYFLYRFAASFTRPSRLLEWVAGGLTGGIVLASVFAPHFPSPDEARPAWVTAYLVLLIVQWSVLLVTVAARLWRGGRGQPTVSRKRMRVLAFASTGLMIAIIVSGLSPNDSNVNTLSLVVQSLVLVSAAAFMIGLAPPRTLRVAWRQPDEDAAREVIGQLMRATERKDVLDQLLPYGAAMVGARSASLVDPAGNVLGAYELPNSDGDSHNGDAPRAGSYPSHPRSPAITIPLQSGTLVVEASSYTPFFGREEVDLVRSLGGLADLALQRCDLMAREREFVADAAHELRTPLTTMSAVAATFAAHWNELSAEHIQESIDALERQGERARILIENLLDLAKLERGTTEIRLEPVAVGIVVKRALETAPEPQGKTVEVEVDDLGSVLADPHRLQQVFTNLLTNAYRYGGKRIRIESEMLPNEVVLTVADDGPGVPKDLIPHIFQPFTRGRDSRGLGSGLGLAIVHRLVDAFGGKITCEAGQPNGARFNVRLRRAA
jgi:signal transduction histidine kinase